MQLLIGQKTQTRGEDVDLRETGVWTTFALLDHLLNCTVRLRRQYRLWSCSPLPH